MTQTEGKCLWIEQEIRKTKAYAMSYRPSAVRSFQKNAMLAYVTVELY